jgi:two-component system NarL family sensor kinase
MLSLVGFIVTILFLYRKRQMVYFKTIETLKLDYEKNILDTQLEIQEQTFQHISREIHDNISLSLTLAKLNLNTIDINHSLKSELKIESSVELITKAIEDLRDISKSLNSELIINQGLTTALEQELRKIESLGIFSLNYSVKGDIVFIDSQKELIIFRIIQEALNNIIKHAKASAVELILNFTSENIDILIADNGNGFCNVQNEKQIAGNSKSGLMNMQKRALMLNGQMSIESAPGKGTHIFVTIPY